MHNRTQRLALRRWPPRPTWTDRYYGDVYAAAETADTLTTRAGLRDELYRLADAGATDVVLLPCSDDVSQAVLLVETLDQLGVHNHDTGVRVLTRP